MTSGELYLIRHGEAEGHDNEDPDLSARGRQQASLVGARLVNSRVSLLLHGPRRRAARTAAIMAGSLPEVPVEPSDLADDRTPVPSPPRRTDYPSRYLSWLDQTPSTERDVDAMVLTRAVNELAREALRRAEDGPVVVVTHAFVIGWFVRSALDAPTWRWLGLHPTNTSLTIVRYSADLSGMLVAFNDDGHLHS